jgi:hypothetical protein
MFAPVDPTIKEKVISAYLAGHGRNQITRDLNGQGIKVSHGSISNIINAYKRKHEQQPSQPQVSPRPSPNGDDAGISTGIRMNIGAGSPLLSGIGQVTKSNANSNSNVVSRDGGPLSYFLGEDNANHASTDEEDSYSNSQSSVPPASGSASAIPPKSEPLFIKDPETEMQINIESGVKYINQYITTQDETTEEEEEFEQSQPRPSLSDSENPSVVSDWNPDESWQTRFWARIMDERRQRQQELLLLEQKVSTLIDMRELTPECKWMYGLSQK